MVWNKGYTKETHLGVLKISKTFKKRHIDNFKGWRKKMKKEGVIPSRYKYLRRSVDLAEYIGVVLGDGNISSFPRTERIIICGNSNNPGFIKRYAFLTKKLFDKEPTIMHSKIKNLIRISLYQKKISERLGIPCGNRKNLNYRVPEWILSNRAFLVAFLKGLFEAEGSLSIHLKTYTYNFSFSNLNESLLNAVYEGLIYLGFHPERRKVCVRLRRKEEVAKFQKMITFREY